MIPGFPQRHPNAGENRFIHKNFIKGSQIIQHSPSLLCYDNLVRKKKPDNL